MKQQREVITQAHSMRFTKITHREFKNRMKETRLNDESGVRCFLNSNKSRRDIFNCNRLINYATFINLLSHHTLNFFRDFISKHCPELGAEDCLITYLEI